jgi:membrane associated rhomboid family serine protease
MERSNGRIDPKILLWIKLFHFAHGQRLKKKRSIPYLVVNLFTNVSNIRSDLIWAQDAAHRREVRLPYISYEDYYKKEQNGLIRPYFTYMYILACIAMMLVAFDRNNWQIADPKINPMLGPPPEVLLELGALESRTMIANNQWWRLVTPMFLHAGIIHLAINMLAMILMMRIIEQSHGMSSTAGLFIVSGLAANLISALLQPGFILVGASGGIFGMLGLMLADIALNWRLLWIVFASQHWDDYAKTQGKNLTDRQRGCYNWVFRFKVILFLVLDVVVNSLVGLTPFIDNFAHMSGLVYGFLLSSTVLEHLPLRFLGAKNGFCHRLRIGCLRLGGAIISFMLMATSAYFLRQSDGTTSPCPKCKFISCIPMPFWKEQGDRWWECYDDCATVRGTAFRANENDQFFDELEIFCPDGEATVTIDVAKEQFEGVGDVSVALPDLCRTYC